MRKGCGLPVLAEALRVGGGGAHRSLADCRVLLGRRRKAHWDDGDNLNPGEKRPWSFTILNPTRRKTGAGNGAPEAAHGAVSELKDLLDKSDSHWRGEDKFYRFYHHSYKVNSLHRDTEAIVEVLRDLFPGRKLNEDFMIIVDKGTGAKFETEHNERRKVEPRRILEAIFHARMMLQLAVKYAGELDSPPSFLPSGWAAVLYLYDLR